MNSQNEVVFQKLNVDIWSSLKEKPTIYFSSRQPSASLVNQSYSEEDPDILPKLNNKWP